MRKFYVTAFFIPLFLFISHPNLNAQMITGDRQFWTTDDFLGFDEVGDCTAEYGDISSVFARVVNKKLLVRVTFDNMVDRKDNLVTTDYFADAGLELYLQLTDHRTRNRLIDEAFRLSELNIASRNFYMLRTPQYNLWEAEISLPVSIARESLEFSIQVLKDGKVVDFFLSDGSRSRAQGNAAFVHHGNQGITYTEVFYGSPNGQSGMDGSGFDEILQVHEATSVPGNFHMSGTLMPAAAWHNPEFNDWLKTLAANGIVEMMTSGLGQHIMPFVHDNMNNWSVAIENDMVEYHYDYTPRTAWVPERVWLSPGAYPDAGVLDWLGDNWAQHGVWGVVLDDWPHLSGYDNRKIHWMNNGNGIDLRVIPINNSFVGNVMYDANGAKNQIAGMGQDNICVYGTDWEVAAEMNEHDGSFFLDNYESILWWCHDNYPAVNVWKLVDAMQNPNFNGTGAEITPGTYGLLGGGDGYGGSNNSWYTQWAATPSRSDFHDPKWNYGYVWNDAHNNLLSAPDNSLAQLGWYTLMINLHETGWHDGGTVADWEHRYSAHIKNANVHAHAARWADGQYETPIAAYFFDADHDGIDEVVIHNQRVFAVFEPIGGKANWVFYKDGLGNAYSVVGSDMAYWSETEGDYNEGSNNHVAALSDVYPYQQDSYYDMQVIQSSGDTVVVEFSQWGVKKRISLTHDVNYLDVAYDFFGSDGYVKSGWSPDLLTLIWSGKTQTQRMWGDFGSYAGQRNEASGATVALVLGNGGAQHNTEFQGTLVLGDEIKGYDRFFARLYAGYTSPPTGTKVPELDALAAEDMDVFPPRLSEIAFQIDENTVEIMFDEAVDLNDAQNIANYGLQNFDNTYTLVSAQRQDDWRKVHLTIQQNWVPGDEGQIVVSNVKDLSGNIISGNNVANFIPPSGLTPHTIVIDGTNDFDTETEVIAVGDYTLYLTWDNNNMYIGFETLDLNGGGDLFVNIDTDQTAGSGAPSGSWGRVNYASQYRAEYQVAIEGGGGSIQLNNFTGGSWNYPGSSGTDSYEGWSGNGLTEISIPWSAIGNPTGIALSVHVTQEDAQVVTAVFPSQNPTGNKPTLTHVYAFYPPYINGDMPFAGMMPKDVFTLPNQSPEIVAWLPEELSQTIEIGQTMEFSVSATDAENDDLSYLWLLNGEEAGAGNSFALEALPQLAGEHQLEAIVSDNVPENETPSVIWQIEITGENILMADFTANLTTICQESQVQFSDASTGNITDYQWNFEGGTPETSTDANPAVIYSTAGSFDVSLTVFDGSESNTVTKADFITVNGPAMVNAGDDQDVCEDAAVMLSAEAQNYSSILWVTSGDGSFGNTTAQQTTYTPGQTDLANGNIQLTITAYPLSPCTASASDTIEITFLKAPGITAQPESVNVPSGADITFEVTATGVEPLTYQWFGPMGEIPGATNNIVAVMNAGPQDEGNYYCVIENDCGQAISAEATLTLEEMLLQTIQIPDGWSGISTWLAPQNPMVVDIFQEMVQNGKMVVFQNYQQLYWPGQNINTIDPAGGWNYESGYQIKVEGAQQISLTGNSPESTILQFDAPGWYLIPVLSSCPVDINELFEPVIDHVTIVKEVAGLNLFWPGVFQNLFALEPGKSYVAHFSAPVSFSWPQCDEMKSLPLITTGNTITMLRSQAIPNPESHIIAFNGKTASQFIPGDRVEILTADGLSLSHFIINQFGKPIAVPLFANDVTTDDKNGFLEGEDFQIMIYRDDNIGRITIETDDLYNDEKLTINGLTNVKSMTINFKESTLFTGNGIHFYPNPAKNVLYFDGFEQIKRLRILSSTGSMAIDIRKPDSQIDLSFLQQGLYFVYIYSDEGFDVKKFIKQ
jgi:PKD repeat protein